jgi:murein DD-endopeptidase MepM/ murein hydrolase activator NlpD
LSRWDWNRVSYVLFVLAVFAALVKVGGMTLADSGPLTPRTANAAPAVAEREPPWHMGTFLELEDDRGFVGEAPAEDETASNPAPREPKNSTAGVSANASSEAPVFYRPSEPGRESKPVCGDLSGAAPDSRVVFPLARAHFMSYSDTWGAARPQGGHEGTDLMVPAGTPEYAVTDGTIVAVSGANENGWNTLGGYTVMIEADRTVGPIKAGDLFYYAHLQAPSELRIGTDVQAGQLVGRAGDTGQGPEVTEGLFPAHLHLGWYDGSGGRSEVDSGAMNPYPLLEWLKGNGGSVSGGSDTRYCEAPQTGGPQPSGGGGEWPAPSNPGQRPDLDTGSDHARPSPAAGRPDPRDERRDGSREEDRDTKPEPRDGGRPDSPEAGPDPNEGDEPDPGREAPGAPEGPDDGVKELPGIVGDGRNGGIGDIPRRVRDRIRDLIPDLIPGGPEDRNPRLEENGGKDEDKKGEKDDGRENRKDPPDKDEDSPRNDDQRPEDPPPDTTDDPAEGDEVAGGEGSEGDAAGDDEPESGREPEGEDPEAPAPENPDPEIPPEE